MNRPQVRVDTTEDSDESLLRRFVESQDNTALDQLIRRYTPVLRRLLATLLRRSPEEIADAEQEVFLTLMHKAHRFHGRSSFSTFFYSLARNKTLDLMRSRKRYRHRHPRENNFRLLKSPYGDPEQAALDEERKDRIRRALETLRPEDRFLLFMQDVEAVGVRRLAEITRMPENTVKSRLKRARAKMAIHLKEVPDE